jgi:hypothetical protein
LGFYTVQCVLSVALFRWNILPPSSWWKNWFRHTLKWWSERKHVSYIGEYEVISPSHAVITHISANAIQTGTTDILHSTTLHILNRNGKKWWNVTTIIHETSEICKLCCLWWEPRDLWNVTCYRVGYHLWEHEQGLSEITTMQCTIHSKRTVLVSSTDAFGAWSLQLFIIYVLCI